MRVTFDPAIRAKSLAERGAAWTVEDAAIVFQGTTVEIEVHSRRNYGEKRIVCYGLTARW